MVIGKGNVMGCGWVQRISCALEEGSGSEDHQVCMENKTVSEMVNPSGSRLFFFLW